MRRWLLRAGATLAGLLALAALLAAFAAWLLVRPMQGEWTAELPLWRGGPRVLVGVQRLVELATDPRWGPHLDGRRLASPVGDLVLRWDAASATLAAQCAPCRLQLPALGDAPLVLPRGEVALRHQGHGRYSGHLAGGATVLPWHGTLSTTGLVVGGELGPRPIAELYALFGDAVPEARRARIAGTLSGPWRASLPANSWSVHPVLQGFEVDGLGTEALAHAELPARCVSANRRAPSPLLAQAVLAAEDQRFHEHPGYDLAEVLRAFDRNQRDAAVRRGGSTLTQQLAKQLYTGDERSAARKLRELLYAVEMERTLGKARILQLYLAMAPWGPVCGADYAARLHIGKPAHRLEAIEAAWLAGLLRQPDAPVDPQRLQAIVRAMPAASRAQRMQRVELAKTWTPDPVSAAPAAAFRSHPSPRTSTSLP